MDQAEANLLKEKIYDADRLAKIAVDHITNDKGEILARVWENPGFQEVYDYKGVLRQRRRLKRKQEQVFNQFDSASQLFQKVYYNPALLQEDEIALRETFISHNASNDRNISIARGAFFLAYWPLTYTISKQVRPTGVLLWTLAYYGVYRVAALGWLSCSLQKGLNGAAEPYAKKYGIKSTEEYLK